MNVVATIEARMASSRLPGKVMMLCRNESMIQRQIRRLKPVLEIDRVVVATTTSRSDDILCDHLDDLGVAFFRGSEYDVLGRVLGAASYYEADVVVQLTGDCPLIDSETISRCISTFFEQDCDLVSNSFERSFPDGMDVTVLSYDALVQIESLAVDEKEREHVLLAYACRPNKLACIHLTASVELDWPDLGLTLDTAEDYDLICKIIEALEPSNPHFDCGQIVRYLRDHPNLVAVNSHVRRKGTS